MRHSLVARRPQLVQNGINVSAEKNSGAGFAHQHRVAAGPEAARLAIAPSTRETGPMITRRHLLGAGAAGALAATLGGRRQALAQQRNLGRNRLVLLGTRGGPRITDAKPSPAANLIVWNNVPYVIDTGYGATFKLVEAKFPLPALRYTFITHRHPTTMPSSGCSSTTPGRPACRRRSTPMARQGCARSRKDSGTPTSSTSTPASSTKAGPTCASWLTCTNIPRGR